MPVTLASAPLSPVPRSVTRYLPGPSGASGRMTTVAGLPGAISNRVAIGGPVAVRNSVPATGSTLIVVQLTSAASTSLENATTISRTGDTTVAVSGGEVAATSNAGRGSACATDCGFCAPSMIHWRITSMVD